MMAANRIPRARTETFVWTDDEVELLLRVTLDYKSTKRQEDVDWESCQSKYGDIMDAFQAQYPRHRPDKDFPHGVNAISKAQVTAKLKSIRGKYRQAVDAGRRSGQGRAVLLFFELCEEIWGGGGSPAARPIDAGIETGRPEESSPESVELSAGSPHSSLEGPPPAAAKRCGGVLQAKLHSHRGDGLKRKRPADPAVQEDMRIKKRMLELMEESTRRYADNMQQINANIANITSTIQEGFSLIRALILQPHIAPPHSSSGGCGVSDAIGCNSMASLTERAAQQSTNRAAYSTGDVEDKWELVRERERDSRIEEATETGNGKEQKIETES